jgi:hypothetical protein
VDERVISWAAEVQRQVALMVCVGVVMVGVVCLEGRERFVLLAGSWCTNVR